MTIQRKTWTLNLSEVLEELIIGEYGLARGEQFLHWLATSDDYYARKLLSPEARQEAMAMFKYWQMECSYSNEDCDRRQHLRSFLLEKVPARIWWSYQTKIASEEDQLFKAQATA